MSALVRRLHTKGDTLIEVLFSITVFSLLAVGGLSIMNQGLSSAQRALEITLVRNEIDAQAETLRFLNSSYVSMYQPSAVYNTGTPARRWFDAFKGASPMTSNTVATDISFCPTSYDSLRPNSFVLNTKNGSVVRLGQLNFKKSDTHAKIEYNSDDQLVSSGGVWIEAVSSNVGADQSNARYIDFHIRACWDSPGQSMPATLGTIVRLYEPL